MTKPRIVIVGAGFGGLFCAKNLIHTKADITLIDCQNYHLFQPLLYQVATGFLGMDDIALPIRSLFQNVANIHVVMEKVQSVDTNTQMVKTDAQHNYPYDYLVLATGAQYHFFGHNEWAPLVHTLKSLEDALSLRRQILLSLEKANIESDPNIRQKYLTYTIIGGGPTGVEVAGSIADLAQYVLKREFQDIGIQDIRIVLLEAASRLLGNMPEKLSAYANTTLLRKGVEVKLNTPVKDIHPEQVIIDQEVINTATIIWAAGVEATPVAAWLGVTPGKSKGVAVEPDLSVKQFPNIFVLGDASITVEYGKALPLLAATAKQQGQYMGKLLRAKVAGKPFLKSFHYINLGNMATIGRNAAVADFGRFTCTGWFAWMLWGLVHIYFLTGFRNRAVVFLTWVWTYLTYGAGNRIILERQEPKA